MIIAAVVISVLSIAVSGYSFILTRRTARRRKPIIVHTAEFDDLARKMREAVKSLPADKRKIN